MSCKFSNSRDTLKASKRSHVGPDETERFSWQKQKEKIRNVSGGCPLFRQRKRKWGCSARVGVLGKGGARCPAAPRSVRQVPKTPQRALLTTLMSQSGLRSTTSASLNPSTLRQPLTEAGLPVTQRASVDSPPLPLLLCTAGAGSLKSNCARHPASSSRRTAAPQKG